MKTLKTLAVAALALGGLAACADTYGTYPATTSAYPTAYPAATGYPSYPAPVYSQPAPVYATPAPVERANPLHQDRPGGSDYDPYLYQQRKLQGY